MKQKFFVLLLSFFAIACTGFGQCLKAGAGSAFGEGITRTSGNSQTDAAIASLVKRINAVLGTSSEFFFYDDSDGANAYASSEDMNIYIGVNFLNSTLNSNTGMTGVAFLIGHELAHIYQFSTRHSNKFMSEETTKNCELQADFLSAYVMGKLGLITPSNYTQMLSKTMDVGDVGFGDQDHHGTPSERKNSAVSGFTFRQLSLSDVYAKSYTYCCPQADDPNRIVYTLNMYNGLTYYVIFGGALCVKRNGEFQKVAQMAATNNYPVTYTFEFSKNDPSKNLYMDINYQLLDHTGRVVGSLIRHDNQQTTSAYDPNSSGSEANKPRPTGPGKSSSSAIEAINACNSTFCKSLQKVILGFNDSFRNLKGEKFGEVLYQSNIKFPDERGSYINMGRDPYYYVTFYRGGSSHDAKQVYEDLKSKFESLGLELSEKSWSSSYVNKETLTASLDLGNGLEISVNWSYASEENKALTTMKIGTSKN
ncbi:MAG TPA: hypothetical protein VD998_02770 [Verrucomicrobiae bacterium]|nr:hypothetical protein [Verrucomicrobiae bacterium]